MAKTKKRKTAKTCPEPMLERPWKVGDRVHWTDPDGDLCSRTFTIKAIDYHPDMARITDTEDGELECPLSELTPA